MRYILILFLLIPGSICLFAQPKTPGKPIQIGLGLTGIAYTGDLSSTSTQFQRVHPGGNFSLQRAGASLFDLQFNTGFGRFTEQTEAQTNTQANTFVETQFVYGDLRIRFRPLAGKKIHPYISAGAGVLVFSPRDQYGKFLIRNGGTRTDTEEKYNTAVPQLPLSGGVHMKINDLAAVSLDYTYRFTPTDYLDNISQLGKRRGFDALHALQLSVYFILSNP
ncbi:MAG: outer membrane beta-barrel protein [Bacteroidia bacterium]